MKNCLLIALSVLALCLASCSNVSDDGLDSLVKELDRAIDDRPEFVAAKEAQMDSLKKLYREASSPADRFEALGHLYDEYRSYNSDSAMMVCRLRQVVAPTTGNPSDTLHANLNMADQLVRIGAYNEALAILEPVASTDLPDYLWPYLFHLKRTVYGLLNDYAVRDEDRIKYSRLTDAYRDSLLSVNDPGSLTYQMVVCDQLNAHGKPAEAVKGFKVWLDNNQVGSHETAIAAFTLSDSYRRMGDVANEKRQLLISSINDMKSAVKEYISLRSLALLLYQEGDVKHAYKYLKLCMEDAQECNARQRMVEINSIFPVVNQVYLDTIGQQQRRLHLIITVVCLLSIFLMCAIFFIRKQMKRVTEARHNVEVMNGRLTELNSELKDYNHKLLDANQAIAENSYLKEEYIARYMDQCLGYIDKLDSYRKSLNKLALAENIDELKKRTKSVTFIDSELKAFYGNFDETFLKLFPTFVDDFNALLRPEERIVPKVDGSLTTELRIFALIRLGITDSVKIAKFLRYSSTTIYNYRTRVRNKALGNRDALERELMKIGRSDHNGPRSL